MSNLIFKNYGGSYQLRIQDVEDLMKIQKVDEVYWAATSIPVKSLNCDSVFTSYVDTDKNGRIRSDELKASLSWLLQLLSNHSHLSEGTDTLWLTDINTAHPEGQTLKETAELILKNLNIQDLQKISLIHVQDVKSFMAKAANNGDGIIPPEAVSDPDLSQFIVSVMETVGSVMDASGKPGINEDLLNRFFQETEVYLAWKKQGEIPQGKVPSEIMPWGPETVQAFELVAHLKEKIDQFFTQCLIVQFDENAASKMQLRNKELEGLDFKDSSMMENYLKEGPLALPNPEGILDLTWKINPIYSGALKELKEKVIKRAFGNSVTKITKKDWEKIESIFVPYQTWIQSKQGIRVEKLGLERLKKYKKGTYKGRIDELIAKDSIAAVKVDQIRNLEKLILYQRWLLELVNNFVSFAHIYDPQHRSMVEIGTLVIDGREIKFAMGVQDRQSHKGIAEKSLMYLLYVEVTGRQDKDIKFEIVAPVTSGTSDGLHVGKRGIFFTIDGREWDAEVVDIVVNPISIWESVKAPFKQFSDFVKKQINRFTQSGRETLDKSLSAPDTSGMARNLLLGGGIAIAALGSAFAYITKALSQVKLVHVLGTLVSISAIVILPGIILGVIKIRKRDMSVLLEASGWAVNLHMRLNAALGRLFTHIPLLPKGAKIERKDVITQFIKDSGFISPRSKKFLIKIIIIAFIAFCLIGYLITQLGLKGLIYLFK